MAAEAETHGLHNVGPLLVEVLVLDLGHLYWYMASPPPQT